MEDNQQSSKTINNHQRQSTIIGRQWLIIERQWTIIEVLSEDYEETIVLIH
jgi:hypothetical protein